MLWEGFMIQDLIEQIFHKKPTKLEKLEKGLTNKNYKAVVNDKTYVIRVPYENSEHIVNYTNEKKALEIIQGANLDVKTIYYNEKTGVKATEFVEGLISFDENTSFHKYEQVGLLMRKLHSLNTLIQHEFDPIKTFKTYRSYITNPMISDKDAQLFVDYVKKNRVVSTLCHNDWVKDNICFTDKRIYLLDYEYAGDNDPMFDVTSFLSENNVTNPIHRNQFLEAYFDKNYPKNIEKKLLYWEGFHHLLWCTWALMMFEQRKTPIYLSIAHEKKQAFDEIIPKLQ